MTLRIPLPKIDHAALAEHIAGYRAELVLQHAICDKSDDLREAYARLAIEEGICTRAELDEYVRKNKEAGG